VSAHAAVSPAPSLVERFAFWWLLLVVVQQAQRVFLIGAAALRDVPSPTVLGLTLVTGLRADLVTASFAMLAALAVALVVAAPVALRGRPRARAALVRTLGVAAAVLSVAYVAVLTVDMGYYLYSGQRLDAVFMEYVTDLLGQGRHGEVAGSQVGAQTAAELSEVGTWAVRVLSYAALMTAAIVGWRLVFRRGLAGALAARPRATALALPLAVAVGAWGVHPGGPDSVQSAPIASSTYYALAQSPIWIVKMAVETSGKRAVIPPAVQAAMPESRAIPLAREMLAPGARFVSPRYPLVHVEEPRPSPLARRPNVLVLFLEALDRRFVGRTIAGRRVTPFLDAIVADSVSFEHFHANGAQTFHGLFASLCSSLPRQGTAATKARYANDYLCLPTLLTRGGYRTRMVIGQNRDRSHSRLGLFMAPCSTASAPRSTRCGAEGVRISWRRSPPARTTRSRCRRHTPTWPRCARSPIATWRRCATSTSSWSGSSRGCGATARCATPSCCCWAITAGTSASAARTSRTRPATSRCRSPCGWTPRCARPRSIARAWCRAWRASSTSRRRSSASPGSRRGSRPSRAAT